MPSTTSSTPSTSQKRSQSTSQPSTHPGSQHRQSSNSSKPATSTTNTPVRATASNQKSPQKQQRTPSAPQSSNGSAQKSSRAQSPSDGNSVVSCTPEKKARNLSFSENDPASNAQHDLPFSKIRSIMTTTPESMRANEEGLYAMTKAAEAFIGMLAKGAFEHSNSHILTYSNLAEFVQENENLNHIHEMVPRKVKFSKVRNLVLAAQNAYNNK